MLWITHFRKIQGARGKICTIILNFNLLLVPLTEIPRFYAVFSQFIILQMNVFCLRTLYTKNKQFTNRLKKCLQYWLWISTCCETYFYQKLDLFQFIDIFCILSIQFINKTHMFWHVSSYFNRICGICTCVLMKNGQ